MSARTLIELTAETGRRCPRRMPPGWEPPVPAWVAELADVGTSVCCVGVQYRDGSGRAQTLGPIERFARQAACCDFAWYRDAAGYRNDVVICYFTDANALRRATAELARWWDDPQRLREDAGYWREIFAVPASHRETLFSADDRPAGVARAAAAMVGPVAEHGYWGAARDRIPVSADQELVTAAPLAHVPRPTLGRRLRISPPANVCIIRSGQDLGECEGRELEEYKRRVEPALLQGMDFLRDHPAETGCYSCRFMTELQGTESTARSFGLAAFASLGHLERWAAQHPTHLAIFDAFLQLAQELGPAMRLRLWHEIFVLQGGSDDAFEYLNCHPGTGLLPFVEPTVAA